METTKLSSKGQIVLPSRIRSAHEWEAGMEFIVEDTPEGVLLRPADAFERTRLEDVVGSAGYDGPAKTVEQMDAGVAAGAKAHRDRG